MKISLKIGLEAEDKAVKYLLNNGYLILSRNFHSYFGEIDIVAKKDEILHFFEVKYSKNYDAITRITAKKLQKIVKTINYYMYKNDIDLDFQLNAILIKEIEIEIVENISI